MIYAAGSRAYHRPDSRYARDEARAWRYNASIFFLAVYPRLPPLRFRFVIIDRTAPAAERPARDRRGRLYRCSNTPWPSKRLGVSVVLFKSAAPTCSRVDKKRQFRVLAVSNTLNREDRITASPGKAEKALGHVPRIRSTHHRHSDVLSRNLLPPPPRW